MSFNLSFPMYLGRLFNLSQPQFFSICSKHFTNEPSKHSINDSYHYSKMYREDLIILIVLIKWWTVFMKIKKNSEENPYCLIWMVGAGRLRHLCQNRSCFGTKYTEISVQTRAYLNNFLNLLWHLVLNSLRVWILCLFSAPSRILA